MSTEKLPPDGYELGPGWKVGSGAPFCSTRRLPLGNCHRDVAYTNEGEAVGLCVMHSLLDGAIVRKAEAPAACDVCGDPEPHVRMAGECFTRTEEGKREAFPEVPPEQPSGNAGQLPAEAPKHRYGCATTMRGGKCDCAVSGCLNCAAEQPAEAPAAPVGETGEEACARLGIDVRQWAAGVRAKVAAAMPMPAAVALEAVIKAMTVNFGQVYDGHSVCAEDYGLIDRLRGIYKNPGGERRWAVAPIHKEAADRIAAIEAELAARLVERDGWMEAAAKSEAEKTAAVQAERERCLGWWDWWWDRPDVTGNDFEDRIKNGDPAP